MIKIQVLAPTHTKEIFNRLEILALPNLIAKCCLCLMHKIYLKVAPPNIISIFNRVDRIAPRREPEYFEIPYNRLKSTDKSMNYVGPKMYNLTVNAVNRSLKDSVTQLQEKFTNSFKATVNRYLLEVQARDQTSLNWSKTNYALM